MKKIILATFLSLSLYACNTKSSDNTNQANTETTEDDPNAQKIPTPGGEPADYDANRGAGKYNHVELGPKLDLVLATSGEKLYSTKCSGCHKLSDEKLVGPGWKGVTQRNKPEWIMNFITNTDEMLNRDPKVQAQLEVCLVRMPDQNLAEKDARPLLEFMRKNDGIK